MQIDFSTVFNHVSHSFFPVLCCGSWWCCFEIIAGFLCGRVHGVVVVCVRSENLWVGFGVPHVFVLDLLLFLLYTSYLPMIKENIFVDHANDSTSYAEVPETFNRVSAVLSANRDLAHIVAWFKCSGMLANPIKI